MADLVDPGRPEEVERWYRIDALFSAALELPEEARSGWLREQCGHDREALADVQALLQAAAEPSFLDTTARESLASVLGAALERPAANRSGTVLGPYRLVQRIGRGGMADVYLAEREDGRFDQRVAIKVQRRGLDTDDLLARFRSERQILSDLSHPNIARLLDGGATDDGLPYLVMEYVDGLPITEFCWKQRLSLRERLLLFDQVARAVQAAHAGLTVHRDIKPTNVLVTPDGQVKLLDFGIAKILDPTSGSGVPRTRTGLKLLTPEYASPELVTGAPITTASDIYQLGLLLFEILTARRPFEDVESGSALEQAIVESRPDRPSSIVRPGGAAGYPANESGQIARRLHGDLDIIVLTALRKEPERRYPSAFEMAEDIRRHLTGHPIWAHRDSRTYRVRKLLKRNPWIAPGLVAANVAMALFIGTLIRHGRQMEAERNTARIEAEKTREAQNLLIGLFRSADPFAPVSESRIDMRVSDVMDLGIRRARTELANRPELQMLMLGTIGDVFMGLGDSERALELRREVFDTAREWYGEDAPQTAVAHRELIEPTLRWILREPVLADSAVMLAIRALNDVRRAFGQVHVETARAEIAAATAMSYSASYPAGEVIVRHALAMLDALGARAPVERAEGQMVLTQILITSGPDRWPEAVDVGREAVSAASAAFGDNHPWTWSMRIRLAGVLSDPVEADSLRRAAIDAFEAQLGEWHDVTLQAYLAEALALTRRGDHGHAADVYRLLIDRRLARGDDPGDGWLMTLTRSYADAARTTGRYGEAEAAYRTVLDFERASTASSPAYTASVQARRAWTLIDLDRPAEALSEALSARRLAGDSHKNPLLECVLGRAFRANGRSSDADSVLAIAADLIAETGHLVRDYHPCWGVTPD